MLQSNVYNINDNDYLDYDAEFGDHYGDHNVLAFLTKTFFFGLTVSTFINDDFVREAMIMTVNMFIVVQVQCGLYNNDHEHVYCGSGTMWPL